jgi:hypothetical protein
MRGGPRSSELFIKLDNSGFEKTLDWTLSSTVLLILRVAYHWCEYNLIVRPQTIFFCRFVRLANVKVVQIESHVSLEHLECHFVKEKKGKKAYFCKGAEPRFEVLHHIPVVRSCQVDFVIRKTNPPQENVEEFGDVITTHIQR